MFLAGIGKKSWGIEEARTKEIWADISASWAESRGKTQFTGRKEKFEKPLDKMASYGYNT